MLSVSDLFSLKLYCSKMAFKAIVFMMVGLSQVHQASGIEADVSSMSSKRVYEAVHNRVRDIVGMLQDMQQKATKDGNDDEELFGKYMFYCRKGRASMEASIEVAEETDMAALKSSIEDEEDAREQIFGYIAQDQAKKADAQESITKAKELREYEAKVFEEESTRLRDEIAAMKDALADIEKGKGLQESTARLLKQLSGSLDFKKKDSGLLTTLLKQIHNGDETKPSEVYTILTHVIDILEKKLADIVREERIEQEASTQYKDMIRETTKGLKADMQEKTAEVEKLDEELDAQKEELADTAQYLMEGPAFLPFIKDSENCTAREDEWADRCQLRVEELSVISEVSNMLQDESILDDLFQQSLPAPWNDPYEVLLPTKQKEKPVSKFDLVALSLKQGTNASLLKISNVFDGVKAMLGKEQAATNIECGQSLDQTQEQLKKLTVTITELGESISHHEKTITNLTGEIHETHAGLEKLDQRVADVREARKREHEANEETLTSSHMSIHLFRDAVARLRQYYSEGESVTAESDGVTLAEIIGPFMKQRETSTNTIALLDATIDDLAAEIAKLEVKEDMEQNQWEEMAKESLKKLTHDTKAISDKSGAKAELEVSLKSAGKDKLETMQEVKAVTRYLSELQGNSTGFLRPSVCTKKSGSSDVLTMNFAPPKFEKLFIW